MGYVGALVAGLSGMQNPVLACENIDDATSYTIQTGDGFFSALRKAAVPHGLWESVRQSLSADTSLGVLQPGQRIRVGWDASGAVDWVRYEPHPLRPLCAAHRESRRFELVPIASPVTTEAAYHTFRIDQSVRASLHQATGSHALFDHVWRHLRWRPMTENSICRSATTPVDESGDPCRYAMRLVVEEKKQDNVVVGYGRIFAFSLERGQEAQQLFFYRRAGGETGYYTLEGQPFHPNFIETPVYDAVMTSGFGPRMHPVLGEGRWHLGVDLAAPEGTPVHAAADGVVEEASRHPGLGNLLVLSHEGDRKTRYAHLSGFEASIAPGMLVRRGQLIGYVGQTGLSTGAHLHFEVYVGSRPVDPRTVTFPAPAPLTPEEVAHLQRSTRTLRALINQDSLYAGVDVATQGVVEPTVR
jgi:murein DD-endopeptidase MepM/ murein hydrolase activator NlpD